MEDQISISLSVTEDGQQVHLEFNDTEGSDVFDIYTDTESWDDLCIQYLEAMGYQVFYDSAPKGVTIN